MLACPKCGHDNDLGRIFCAQCGEKLDITKVGPPTGISKKLGKKGAGRHIPVQERITIVLGKTFKVCVLAMIASLLTLAYLPPRLERKNLEYKNFENYTSKLEIADSAQDGQVTFDEADLNAGMAKAVLDLNKSQGNNSAPSGDNAKPPDASAKGFQLVSVYFGLDEDTINITAERKWKWFCFSPQITVAPVEKEGKVEFSPVGARIGRLMLAPYGIKGMDSWILGKVTEAFGRIFGDAQQQKDIIAKASEIKVKPGQITLSFKKS